MRLGEFIQKNTSAITSDWEVFARSCVPAATRMDLEQRRDHIAGMLKAIAVDLDTAQSKKEQAEKAAGQSDAHVDSHTAANAHGSDRAAIGYSPEQMVSEFRALRASVLRLWSEASAELTRESFNEMTRFNEAIDQLLAESIARYAQEVDRSKDLFLGVLGHDLRNPLGAILMSATLMLRKEDAEWPHRRLVSSILNSGTRMDTMIGDLVDFTRTRLGAGIPVTPSEMDLGAVAQQAVDEIRAFHPDCVVHCTTEGELVGRWDPGRIGQALSNVVGNAYQHGAPGEPIDVTIRGEPEQVTVSVHNRGPAIPQDDLDDIFSPFRQLNPARARTRGSQSLGLGLYIADSIMTAHEGTIDVESNDGGTTFTLHLPRTRQTTDL